MSGFQFRAVCVSTSLALFLWVFFSLPLDVSAKVAAWIVENTPIWLQHVPIIMKALFVLAVIRIPVREFVNGRYVGVMVSITVLLVSMKVYDVMHDSIFDSLLRALVENAGYYQHPMFSIGLSFFVMTPMLLRGLVLETVETMRADA